MKQVKYPNFGLNCRKHGRTNAGSQRWICKQCKCSFTNIITKNDVELQRFLNWLFGKTTQSEIPGQGRSFRRTVAKFWNFWPLPLKVEVSSTVVFVDGIYLARNACVLICCNEKYVLGWYVCRYEHSRAWHALLQRIASSVVVIFDGVTGFQKALKKVWLKAKLQRCIFMHFNKLSAIQRHGPKVLLEMNYMD